MKKIIETPEAEIHITEVDGGKFHIVVIPTNTNQNFEELELVTSYSISLIEEVLKDKGPFWFINEIKREESPEQIQLNLYYGILGFVSSEEFKGKRILDFGCGCGSSTMVLARMFPESEIIGLEFLQGSLDVAEARKNFYGFSNISFLKSETPKSIPVDIGNFDYVLLSAVYEHLLPQERVTLFPIIFDLLKPGGVMFINELPYRYFPLETHTTGGLPFINYLPVSLAEKVTNYFSKRNINQNWQTLLRNGIRGGSEREILKNINDQNLEGHFLKPSRLGLKDDIDIWYRVLKTRYSFLGLGLIHRIVRIFKNFTGISMIHLLTLALKKED